MLIKAEKTRQGFNDLQNRNMLLEMASFVKSRWLIFIDADERFDERFNSPRRLVDVDADIIGFPFVHLWDGEDQYCVDYPASKDGIQIRLKMFRHLGRTQILSKKALHFAQVPFRAVPFMADALIKHYGRIDQDTRAKKFVFYQHEDRDKSQADYRHLLRRNAKVASLDQLKID